MKKMVKGIFTGDRKLFYMINKNIKCRILDFIMPYVSKLGGAIFTILLPISLMIFGQDKVRLIGLESFASLSISHLMVQVIKRTVTRLRPYDVLKHIHTFNNRLKDYSFPSGHTTASFSIAIPVALNASSLMMPVVFLAGMVGISRIYIGVHYPSDVVVGAVLGIGTSMMTHSMLF